ncbi:DUF501 domain-containing protein [Amnibacterium sp.]|uniref:DUF501 domain-containing protein n=1 Tax=Amnibacterium sp. TaxID=1872496 RepID=UPI0026138E76|nr:DUF501 domain-containing protein [Amnibacterium sp.]MCU1472415.1 septum formation initiator family protein [Amnibacterium sp.]
MSPPTEADLAAVSAQLGRPARDVLAIAARSRDGEPAVVSTAPRLADGTPFPTFYYLTHPLLVAAISRLEADGRMRELNARLEAEPELAAAYEAAHRAYLADREAVAVVPELAGVSAGGMPTRVKCLHALAAHALAAGPGVNPLGDLVLAEAAAAEPAVARAVGARAAEGLL